MNFKNTIDMNNRFLFPKYFKRIGFWVSIPTIILDCLIMYGNAIDKFFQRFFPSFTPKEFELSGKVGYYVGTYLDTLAIVLTIIVLLMIAFSKEKIEDEYVAQIRLESLQWAVYCNFALLIIFTLFVYGFDYYDVTVYNMFTPLVIFILRFNYILHIKPSFEKNPERSLHEQ
jgi:hypothetical protein